MTAKAKGKKKPEPIDATILFADMIDSSLLSHVYEPSEYDDLVAEFQKTAADVVADTVTKDQFTLCTPHVEVSVRGDELCLILGCTEKIGRSQHPKCHPNRCVWTALQVAIRLKRRWLLSEENKTRMTNRQPPLGVAIGIHAGTVIIKKHKRFTTGKNNLPVRSQEICTAEGYAINTAKRVETVSRSGRFSSIFLTRSIYNRTPADFRLAFVRVDPPEFKGISVPPVTYEAKGIGHFDDKRFPTSSELGESELQYLEDVVKAYPDEIWLLLDLAHKYFDEGKYDEAAEKYKEVLEVDASFAPAHMYLGRSHFRSYRMPEARAALERSLQLDPAKARANHFLAVCLRREALLALYDDQPEVATELFKRSIDLHQTACRIENLENLDYPWAENGLIATVAHSYELEAYYEKTTVAGFQNTTVARLVRPFDLQRALRKIRALLSKPSSVVSEMDKQHLFLHIEAVVLLQQKQYDEAKKKIDEALKALEYRNKKGTPPDEKAYAEKRAEMLFHRGRCKLLLPRGRGINHAVKDWCEARDVLLEPWEKKADQQRVLDGQYWPKFFWLMPDNTRKCVADFL